MIYWSHSPAGRNRIKTTGIILSVVLNVTCWLFCFTVHFQCHCSEKVQGNSFFFRCDPDHIILNYNHEVLPEHTVTLHRILKGNEYRLSGVVNDTVAFEIGGTLRKRV